MKIGIIANKNKPNFILIIKEILDVLLKYSAEVYFLDDFKKIFTRNLNFLHTEQELFKLCEIIIIIGGDGTFLYYSKVAAAYSKSILTINNGRKGALSTLQFNELFLLDELLKNNYFVEKKFMLEGSFCKNNFIALNEIVFVRETTTKSVDFELFCLNQKIYSFRADGVIISTPTGSLAYNLSCGGPLLYKNTNSIVVTPIASMDFHAKPIVFDAGAELNIKYNLRKNSKILVICDGICESNSTEENGYLSIKKSSKTVNFINFFK